ncbi:ABC transporter permease [Nibricoccus sp. IMCC34717]|uniref:ABC transporter permease n=1 Tax=Nibricoccus sp. IMCC34717 TaxID=3034021 RepID=UPI00384A6CA2
MFRLALRMLFGDRAKYLMLISGIMFATILITQGASLFCGIMSWTASTLRNVRAEVWVADPMVEQVGDNKPMRDTDVGRVRSVTGIAWAVPLYQGLTQAKLSDGSSKLVTLIGIDATTLIGAPAHLVEGHIEDLRQPNSVIIDEYGTERLAPPGRKRLAIGDTFELNDREARVVGICRAQRSFTGGPYLFTTYDRAMQYVPAQRKMLTFVLAAPADGVSAEQAAATIRRETGLAAFTETQFLWSTIWWYVANTGIPINVGTIVIIGFIVGVAISGQTFYSFVLENMRNLAALKAMGTSNARLCAMLVLQSLSVGLIGYGIGLGVVSLLGNGLLRLGKVPFLMLWQIPVISLAAVLFICVLSALLGIWRVARIEAAIVFRS